MKKSRPVGLFPISPAPHAVESVDGILVMDPSDTHIIHTDISRSDRWPHSPLLTWTMMVGRMTAPKWRLI